MVVLTDKELEQLSEEEQKEYHKQVRERLDQRIQESQQNIEQPQQNIEEQITPESEEEQQAKLEQIAQQVTQQQVDESRENVEYGQPQESNPNQYQTEPVAGQREYEPESNRAQQIQGEELIKERFGIKDPFEKMYK